MERGFDVAKRLSMQFLLVELPGASELVRNFVSQSLALFFRMTPYIKSCPQDTLKSLCKISTAMLPLWYPKVPVRELDD